MNSICKNEIMNPISNENEMTIAEHKPCSCKICLNNDVESDSDDKPVWEIFDYSDDDDEEEDQIRFTENYFYQDLDGESYESELDRLRDCGAECKLPGNFEFDALKFFRLQIQRMTGLPWDAMTSNEKMFCYSMKPSSNNEALIDYMNIKRRKNDMPLLKV